MISRQQLKEVKKDYLDKVMIRDGSEESKEAEQILNEACEAFINDINEWLKKIVKEVVMGFSIEIFITFFSEKDGTC